MTGLKKVLRISVIYAAILAALVFGIGNYENGASRPVSNFDGMLIAGGSAFGMKVDVGGAIIIETPLLESGEKSPAQLAGLRSGDIITGIGSYPINNSAELLGAVESGGGELDIVYLRGGKEKHSVVCPKCGSDGKPKIGVTVRDSAAGIGTITFIEPNTLTFAGLGHGICDSERGALLPIAHGSVEQIKITSINAGKSGTPGEIRGAFTGKRIGKIIKNDETGVYGVLSELPKNAGELYPIASADEISNGVAHVRSAVSGEPELYEVEIEIIGSGEQKNLSVKVTDKRLLALTGGIVQGMSGSPLIQNGKLIGAVTHVLVNDPTRGYGIFIENMLDAAS